MLRNSWWEAISILLSYHGHGVTWLFCTLGLLQMMQAFIAPTYAILAKQDGLRDHPGTVDDFFRQELNFQFCPPPQGLV